MTTQPSPPPPPPAWACLTCEADGHCLCFDTAPAATVTTCPHDELAPPLPNEQLLDSHVVAQRALQAVRMPPLWSVYAACPFYIMATFIAMVRSPLTSEGNRRKLVDLVQWMGLTLKSREVVDMWVPGLVVADPPVEMLHPDGTTSYRPVSEEFMVSMAVNVPWSDGEENKFSSSRRVDFVVAPSLIDGLTLQQCSGPAHPDDTKVKAAIWRWLTTPVSGAMAKRIQDMFDKIYPGAERTRPHSPWHTAKSAVRELGNALGTDR